MSTDQKPKGSWLKFFAKLGIYLSVIIVFILFVMSQLGGNSDTLKSALETFGAQASGYRAEIETLNGMEFYPYTSIDFKNMRFFTPGELSGSVMEIKKFQGSMGFWDMTFSTGAIKTFYIEGFRADAGALLEQSFTIRKLAIVDPEEATPALKGTGTLGGKPWSVNIDVSPYGSGVNRTYYLGGVHPFQFSLADFNFTGKLDYSGSHDIHLQDLKLTAAQHNVSGDVTLNWGILGGLNLGGALSVNALQEGAPVLTIKPDLDIEETAAGGRKITGDIVFDPLPFAALGVVTKISDIADALQTALEGAQDPNKPLSLGSDIIHVDLKAPDIRGPYGPVGSLNIPVNIEDGVLQAGPFSGSLSGARPKGAAVLKTSDQNAALSIKFNLKNMKYAQLQKALYDRADIKGEADILIDLEGQGVNMHKIKEDMSGYANILAGKGEFPASTLNIWGGGLVNAMLPDLDQQSATQLNCLVANFNVEKGIAEAKPLFLDTARITVGGTGTYDIAQDMLDLQLKPEAKGIALGDISAAVNISGPLGAPSIGANTFDLAKRLGGLFLGTINPAFFALSLTDLGLTDDHPCAEFLAVEEQPRKVEE